MQVKERKSKAADLHSKRLTFFLLAMILAATFVFVALEYKSGSGGIDDMSSMFDALVPDMEITLPKEKDDMIQVPSASPKSDLTERIKAVDKPLEAKGEVLPDKADTPSDGTEALETLPKTVEGAPSVADESATPLDFRIVEQIPQFPGGMAAFTRWLNENIRYPEEARRKKIEGKVVVSFVIGTNGKVSDHKVEKAANPLLDKEALRVLSLMPDWKPGMEKGKPCRTLFAIPIVFQL